MRFWNRIIQDSTFLTLRHSEKLLDKPCEKFYRSIVIRDTVRNRVSRWISRWETARTIVVQTFRSLFMGTPVVAIRHCSNVRGSHDMSTALRTDRTCVPQCAYVSFRFLRNEQPWETGSRKSLAITRRRRRIADRGCNYQTIRGRAMDTDNSKITPSGTAF